METGNVNINHPLMSKRDQREFQNKLQAAMAKKGIDIMLISSPENVYYATGYYGTRLVAVVPSKGEVQLVVSDLDSEAAIALTKNVNVTVYPSWVFVDDGTEESFKPKGAHIDPLTAVKRAVDIILQSSPTGVIGVETSKISAYEWKYLVSKIQEDRIQDCQSAIMESRMVKTEWEIDMLRRAAKHSEKMMRATFERTRPGMTMTELQRIMMTEGLALDTDMATINLPLLLGTAGEQYASSGLPREYVLKEGDLVRLDGGFSFLGYYGDLARTYVVGGNPSPVQEELFAALYEGHKVGIEMFKPGVKLADIYHKVISVVESSNILKKYPRGHVGHSIGLARVEEYPQISPDSDIVLQPGMVFSFEVPYYGSKNAYIATGPINIEDSLVITEDGMERFTNVNSNLRWD